MLAIDSITPAVFMGKCYGKTHRMFDNPMSDEHLLLVK